jgi:7-cyano-7-deazaguanine synthase
MLDCVAIVSGGMDSVTMLHQLVKVEQRQPAVITFAYGQKHDQEIHYAQVQVGLLGLDQHLLLDLNHLRPLFAASALVASDIPVPEAAAVLGDPQPPTYVPNRNMIFLALAAAYAETQGVSDIYYGAQSHDLYGYWDTTPQFLDRLNQVYQLNRQTPIQIKAPLVHYTKSDILRLGLELEVDYAQTWSCYAGEEVACGRCPTCAERRQAFMDLGLDDPLPYAEAAARYQWRP